MNEYSLRKTSYATEQILSLSFKLKEMSNPDGIDETKLLSVFDAVF